MMGGRGVFVGVVCSVCRRGGEGDPRCETP